MAMWKGFAVLASIMPGSMGSFCGPQVKAMVDALNAMRGEAGMISWDQTLAAQAQQQLNGTCRPEIQAGESHYRQQFGWISSLDCQTDLSKAAHVWNKDGKEWDGTDPDIKLIGCGVASCPFSGKSAYLLICKYDWCADCQSNRDPYGGVNTTLPEEEGDAAAAGGVLLFLICICCCCCAGCGACVVSAVRAKPEEAKPVAGSHELLQSDQETGDGLLIGDGETDDEPKRQCCNPTAEGFGYCCFRIATRCLCKLLTF